MKQTVIKGTNVSLDADDVLYMDGRGHQTKIVFKTAQKPDLLVQEVPFKDIVESVNGYELQDPIRLVKSETIATATGTEPKLNKFPEISQPQAKRR